MVSKTVRGSLKFFFFSSSFPLDEFWLHCVTVIVQWHFPISFFNDFLLFTVLMDTHDMSKNTIDRKSMCQIWSRNFTKIQNKKCWSCFVQLILQEMLEYTQAVKWFKKKTWMNINNIGSMCAYANSSIFFYTWPMHILLLLQKNLWSVRCCELALSRARQKNKFKSGFLQDYLSFLKYTLWKGEWIIGPSLCLRSRSSHV